MFLDEARAVLARAAVAQRALEDLGGLNRGTLTIRASQTIASYWLPVRLVAFRKAYPQIEIKLSVGNTLQVTRAVSDGSVELGFVEGKVSDPALNLAIVAHDRLAIVVAPNHPWSCSEQLYPEAVIEGEWVLREPGSGTRSEFEDALIAREIGPSLLKVALELPSNEAVRAAVEAGVGATAISELVAASGIKSGSLVRVPFELPERVFHVVRHRERYQSRAAAAFLAVLQLSAI